MPRQAALITLSQSDQAELEHWVAAHRTPQQVARRCRCQRTVKTGQFEEKIIGRYEPE